MSLIYKGRQDGASRHLDPASHHLEHGITYNLSTNIRTFSVLNALASLCISAGTSEVLAIGLQLDAQAKKVRLIIAGNPEIKQPLRTHLRHIWSKLQNLSLRYADHMGRGSRENDRGYPPVPAEVAVDVKIALFLELDTFSVNKQMRRVEEWNTTTRNGRTCYMILDYCKVDIPPLPVHQQKQAHTGPNLMVSLSPLRPTVLNLANIISPLGNAQTPFRLRRALEKLTSHSRRFETLVAFANSPRLQRAFRYKFELFALPEISNTITPPQATDAWKTILQDASGVPYEGQWDDALDLIRHYKKSEFKKWYWPWGTAKVEVSWSSKKLKEELESIVVRKITTEYGAQLEWRRTLSVHSDNTDASISDIQLYFSEA
ncbi:hypothetical protein HOY82DRAFT_596950 [Tuber indicum]|nr:hypothetical protein HOY82DRAFT_596950 [Tuber indicum]